VSLTKRELQVITLIADGLGDIDIGEALGIAPSTAHFHACHVLKKLGKPNRASAAAEAVRKNLIE
jgi:DNA-binding NarL/FixJ family response regulator